MTFNFLCVCVSVRPSVRVCAEKSARKTSVFRGVVSLFLAGFVGGRPLFFLSGACVCCLVMMIKHAGRKYSIPTKPKKSYTAAASKQAEWRPKRRRQAARYRFPGKTSTATADYYLLHYSSFVPCTALIGPAWVPSQRSYLYFLSRHSVYLKHDLFCLSFDKEYFLFQKSKKVWAAHLLDQKRTTRQGKF